MHADPIRPAHPGHAVLGWLVVLGNVLLVASRLAATPTRSETEGWWRDDFTNSDGIAVNQNARVGPALSPGVCVALNKWNWTQSYTPASNTISTLFSDIRAQHNLTQVNPITQVNPTCSTCKWEDVGLWRQEYAAGQDFTLGASVTKGFCCRHPRPFIGSVLCQNPVNTFCLAGYECCGNNLCCPDGITCADGMECLAGLDDRWVAVHRSVEELNGQFLLKDGPFQMNLEPEKDYTVTFKVAGEADPSAEGADLGRFRVVYGDAELVSFPATIGNIASGVVEVVDETGSLTPVTLAWKVPLPLPPGSGWEYQLKLTLSASGDPATPPCAPNCTATVWVDTVTVQAQGHPIPWKANFWGIDLPFMIPSDCSGGKVPCGDECIQVGMQCGWDAATVFMDTGSYVSPVFDSLSEQTVWDTLRWEVEQNYSGQVPTTPVTIKWRVGNGPDPSLWLGDPTWYTWTIPYSVTCTGERPNADGIVRNCDPTLSKCGSLLDKLCDCSSEERDQTTFPCFAPIFPYVFHTGYPPPMANEGEYPLFADGDPTKVLRARYFQYEVDFTSHFANRKYSPGMAAVNKDPAQNDAPQPLLKSIRVFYRPAVGRVISNTVAPVRLRKWKSVKYKKDESSGGSVQVDVLDQNNVPLFTNVPDGFSLTGLDPGAHPVLRLRATMDNGGDSAKRPCLLNWELSWETFTAPLRVECNSLSLSQGDRCTIAVVMFSARAGSLTIHDVAGQLVKELYRGTFPGLTQITRIWDGTNTRGDRVAPGVYFVALRAKEIRRIKKLAVVP